MAVVVGLDIGGTKLMVASASQEGKLIKRARVATPLDLFEGIECLHHLIAQVAGGEDVSAIGVAAGGPLNYQTGVISPLHQPQWRNVPLREMMEAKWRHNREFRFFVDVDTNVAALGEYYYGNVQYPRLLYITLSTGVGGGFLLDGKIYRGQNGAHPEVGHQSIAYRCSYPERILCECGADDCVEALISGNGIRRIYNKPAEALTEEEWSEVTWNIAVMLRNLAVIYAPDVIVLGGGIACGRGGNWCRRYRN